MVLFQLADWLGEKMLAAQDETYRDAKSIHSKYMRHQAFELEIKSNKNQLEKLIKDGKEIIAEKPELEKVSVTEFSFMCCLLNFIVVRFLLLLLSI